MSGPMTLRALISALDAHPKRLPVLFTGAGLDGQSPDRFVSWRAVYALLAITHGDQPCTVARLLKAAKAANGAYFYGWKGGHYLMGPTTTLHVDNAGNWSGRYLAEVRRARIEQRDVVELVVEEGEDW